jgi:hypothetical protein
VVEFAAAAEKGAEVLPTAGNGGVGRGVAVAEEVAEVTAVTRKTGERAATVISGKSVEEDGEGEVDGVEVLTRFYPGNAHVCGLSIHGALWGSDELDGDQTKAERREVLPRFGSLGRVMTYVLLV